MNTPAKAPLAGVRDRLEGDTAGHWVVFTACSLFLGIAFFLSPAQPGQSLQFAGKPTPSICQFKNTTQLDCPGCGLTRSWVAAAHGHIRNSLIFHPLGWLLWLYTALQWLRHAVCLVKPTSRVPLKTPGKWLDRSLIVLPALLLLAWPFRLATQLGWLS